MSLSEYFRRLQEQLRTASPVDESVLMLLYEVFSETNAMYDDVIKADFRALYETMNGMPLREMDRIIYPVCTLCRDHQKTGFIEGVRIGFRLCLEAMSNSDIGG